MSSAHLVFSDESCVLDGTVYSRIPMLIDKHSRVVWSASDWFRFLYTDSNLKESTAIIYAYTLAAFWRFIEKKTKTPWYEVDDRIIRLWRNHLIDNKEDEPGSINNALNTVIAFYKWAQEFGYVFNIIGVTLPNTPPFPIRLIAKSSGRRSAAKTVTHLLLKIPRKARKAIPTMRELEELFQELSSHDSPYISRRNYLIAKSAVGSGLRRDEDLNLKKTDLPSREHAEEMQAQDEMCWLTIVGKGGHTREVPILPEIVLEFHDFIEYERSELVQELGGAESDFIFLSTTTGTRLSGEHVSRVISAAFDVVLSFNPNPNNRKLTLHRLRARFASKLVQTLKRIEEARTGTKLVNENIVLERAATMLGHGDLKSLRYYLDTHLDVTTAAVVAASRSALGQAQAEDATRKAIDTPVAP